MGGRSILRKIASDICPYLERAREGYFACAAQGGKQVDPALNPCLLSHRHRANACPPYAKAILRELAQKAYRRASRRKAKAR